MDAFRMATTGASDDRGPPRPTRGAATTKGTLEGVGTNPLSYPASISR